MVNKRKNMVSDISQKDSFKWDNIIPLSRKDDTDNIFPVEAFPVWAKNLIREVGAVTQTPSELAASVLLTLTSGCIAKHIYTKWHETPTNLWMLTLYPSGGGKSPVFRIMSEPFINTDLQQYMVADITPEELVTQMYQHNEKAIVLEPEGSFFDNLLTNRNIGYTNYLHMHSEEPVKVNRSKKAVNMSKASLTLGIMTQLRTFQAYMKNAKFKFLTNNGLMSRFLVSIPMNMIGKRDVVNMPEKVSDDIMQNYMLLMGNLIKNIEKYHGLLVPFADKDVEMEFRRIHQGFENEIYEYNLQNTAAEPFMCKMNESLLRLAGNLAVLNVIDKFNDVGDNRNQIVITSDILASALLLITYYKKAYFHLCSIEYKSGADKMLTYLKNHDDGMTRRKLQHGLNATCGLNTSDQFSVVLQKLVEHHYIYLEEKKTKGPKTVIVHVNPAIFSE